jgi:hypothetical protein
MTSPIPRPAHATRATRATLAILGTALVLTACTATSEAQRQATASAVPATDCTAWVGTDRNAMMGGYLLPSKNGSAGAKVCVPVLMTANPTPAGYAGGDYHVAEFTDDKLKARWRACKDDPACFKRIDAQMQRWLPPNKERATRSTGVVDPSARSTPTAAST